MISNGSKALIQFSASFKSAAQPLGDLEVIYLWADGLYVKAALEDTKSVLLVVIGGCADGRKVIRAVESSQREPAASHSSYLYRFGISGERSDAHCVGEHDRGQMRNNWRV